jgi:hypothetical protein
MEKILVSDSIFLECVDEIATQITEVQFKENTWFLESWRHGEAYRFTEEAQDFYNDKFDEIEALLNNTLNVWNKMNIN